MTDDILKIFSNFGGRLREKLSDDRRKRAMAELRHSSSISSHATPSPSASTVTVVASSPLPSDYDSAIVAADDDLYRVNPHRSKISIIIFVVVVFTIVISVSSAFDAWYMSNLLFTS